MRYTVVLKIGYCYAEFEFTDVKEAADFAQKVLQSLKSGEDIDKREVVIKITE